MNPSLTFAIGSTTFCCIVVDSEQRYEWRTSDGKCRAGRNVGKGTYWAAAGDRRVGQSYPTLRAAMLAAINFKQLQQARAA